MNNEEDSGEGDNSNSDDYDEEIEQI